MKWHKGRMARRRATFETLEYRKLFAIDLAEVTTAALFSSETLSSERATSESVVDGQVELASVKFDDAMTTADSSDSTDPIVKRGDIEDSVPLAYPEIMMMTFRSNEATEDVVTSDVQSEEIDPDTGVLDASVLMTMTGSVDNRAGLADSTDIRTLSVEDDQVDVSSVVDDVITDVIAEEDLIFYSMGPGPEVEMTGVDVELSPEDVNGDGIVTAIDMLLVLNALNVYGPMPSSEMAALPDLSGATNWDINRDGFITPLDTLLLTNYFNGLGSADGADQADSAQSLVAAPAAARIRNPAEDGSFDESAPLIEDQFDSEILERA